MAYKQKGINFGDGTGSNSSPNKLQWTIALEGYHKAWEAHQQKKRNREEAKNTSEMIERVSSKDYVAPSDASSNMVQVWDENLGRKRWVHNPEAYKEQQQKEIKEKQKATNVTENIKNNKAENKTSNNKTKSTSYDKAYKNRDIKTYGKMSKAEYIKEAKRQKAIYDKTGKWDVKK